MSKIFLILCVFFTVIITNAQDNCYKLIDRRNIPNIHLKKEKTIILKNVNYEDYGEVLVTAYFIGDTVIKIKSIKSKLHNNFIKPDNPIYGDIYRELVTFFDKSVVVKYEEKTLFKMTFIFKFCSENGNGQCFKSTAIQ